MYGAQHSLATAGAKPARRASRTWESIDMPDREMIVEVVKAYCTTETEKDREGWMALFDPEIVHEDPVGYVKRQGFEELGKLWDMIVSSDVDLRLIDDVIVCGNEAIGIMESLTGPAGSRRKTGPIIDHFVFNDAGKITSLRAFYNFG
jgi:steroid delta-isomerase